MVSTAYRSPLSETGPDSYPKANLITGSSFVQITNNIHQPYTATGKLKADNTATTPKGFGTASVSIPKISAVIYHLTFEDGVSRAL